MRLTAEEANKIKSIIRRYKPEAQVFLFGSKTNNDALGGDIDLMVIDESRLTFSTKIDILFDLNHELYEAKYDIVSYAYSENPPFRQHIQKHAILI